MGTKTKGRGAAPGPENSSQADVIVAGPSSRAPRDLRGPYGVIYRRLWERPDFVALSFEAHALFVYLRTCPAGELLGIFRFHADDAVDHLRIPRERVEPTLRELENNAFIQRHGRWVWVVDSFESTPQMSVANPNHHPAIRKALDRVPPVLADRWCRLYGFDLISDPIPGAIPDPIRDGRADGLREGMPDHVDRHRDGETDTDTDDNGLSLTGAGVLERQATR